MSAGSTYIIINVQGHTAADLSGQNNKVRVIVTLPLDVIGFKVTKTINQQWTLEDAGDGFFRIRNGTGKYLCIDGDAKKGTRVICSAHQQTWKITSDDKHPNESTYRRILYPGTNLYLDLEGGKPAPRTPVLLWEKDSGKNQAWLFERYA